MACTLILTTLRWWYCSEDEEGSGSVDFGDDVVDGRNDVVDGEVVRM